MRVQAIVRGAGLPAVGGSILGGQVRHRIAVAVIPCLLLLAAGGAATDARAHAALVKADPARRAVLAKAPPQVRLWFNERLEPAYARVTLARTGSGPVKTGLPRLEATDSRVLILDLPPLAPGDYTVSYRVLSLDGHSLEQGYAFSILPPD